MRRWAIVVVLCAAGCRSRAPAPREALSGPSTPPSSARSTIDPLFTGYQDKLPAPATLSEENGASLKCEHHGWVTYTLLFATANKVPIESDADLARLVPWTRNDDVCLRQIAIEAIIRKINFDSNRLATPGMHDPEHHDFHDVLVALNAYLKARKVPVDPKLFAGMMVDVTDKDFATLNGKWEEQPEKGKNFRVSVELDGVLLRVTTKRTQPDPKWPERTSTTTIKAVHVNERGQFVVTAESSAASYSFWPVSKEIVWFLEGDGYWTKLRRGT